MASFDLRREGDVHILEMKDGENQLDAAFLEGFQRALDEVEACSDPTALVTTAEGKYWSTGIHLDWLGRQSQEDTRRFVRDLEGLMRRILLFPVPTVAAINGHAFAGGALLAMAHDYRIMRTDRGWFCFPEVDIRIPFRDGMIELLRARLSPATLRDAVLTGARYGGPEAVELGLVDAAVELDQLIPQAIARVAPAMGKGREIFAALKESMYRPIAEGLGPEPA